MDKEEVVYRHTHTTYTYSGILHSHKKEWDHAICNNIDGLTESSAKWNKLEKDRYHKISLICGI